MTVAFDPLVLSAPFHTCVICWPGARLRRTLQPLTAALPAVTVTCPWYPPGQEFTVWYDAVQAAEGGGEVGGGEVGGGEVGGGDVGGGEVGGGEVGGGELDPPGGT